MRTYPLTHFRLGDSVHPYMVRLAQGSVQAPNASTADLKAAIDQAIQAISTEVEALIVELDAVSPSALNVEPERAQEISYIGSLSLGQIRLAIQTAAQALSSRVDRILSGAAAPYVTAEESSQLTALRSRANSVWSAAQAGASSIPSEQRDGVDQYLSMHLSGPDQAIRSVEEKIVSGEAASVPVIEPFEKDLSSRNIAIGVGLVSITGLILWGLLG